ncbi:nicotinate-nucleotide adenylyltransferase [Enterocloster citroniae]|uniref:Probable nicotinate-nucleotide adenylyltransferase n=2 Tax=Enterocloster citroniae TaxID=358743 RepID=A0ABV2FUV9_9FIRM|nr:nicotinate-nucleotide adenylyltransferase [Enterocloster citroniae]KMW17156.1 nicotinate nucleotide adenylyltransferase [[Clostridium] citroniae WAL-19142]
MARIGILGGTFDPIHNGHLRLGKRAYEEFELESIWFMPSGVPPHKKDHKITEGKMRRDMVKLAIADTPCFLYSDFELKRKGDTYTAQTLSLLHRERPEDEFYFIIGADSLYEIEHWYHPEAVMGQAVLLVAGRAYRHPHRNMEEQIARLSLRYGARIYPIHCPEMDISSEGIRKAVAEGRPIRDAVPEPVEEYIRVHGLYRENAAGGYDGGKKTC